MKLIPMLVVLCATQACKECIETPVHPPEEVRFSFAPEQLTYHKGDTLYFESHIDRSIFPSGFNSLYDRIGSKISCVQFVSDSNGGAFPSAMSFEGKLIQGKTLALTKPDSIRFKTVNILNFIYDLVDSTFVVKAIIVPKDTGYFGLEPFSYGANINLGSPCEKFYAGRVYYHNENTNVEIKEYFFKQAYPGILKRNTYCIHVIE